MNKDMRIRNKITLISFVASIMVIYIHAYNVAVYNLEVDSFVYRIEVFVNDIVSNATSVFFLISGFLFFKNFKISDLLAKWNSRVFSLVIPYVIWASLYYLYYIIVTRVPLTQRVMNDSSLVEFSIRAWLSHLGPEKYFTLWFLQDLIVIILIAPIIWLLVNNHYSKVPTGIAGLFFIIAFAGKATSFLPLLSGVELFSVGAYLGLNCKRIYEYYSKLVAWTSLIAIPICVIELNFIKAVPHGGTLYVTLLCCAIWYALDLVPLEKYDFPWCMRITFFTYVAHSALLEIIEKSILIFGGRSTYMALIDYIFAPIITEVLLILIAAFIRKYMPKVWNIISGRRG